MIFINSFYLKNRNMRNFIFSIIPIVLFLGVASAQEAPISASKKVRVHKVIIDSIERNYYLHIPKNRKANAPLVFVFHGYSGSALDINCDNKFNQIANQNGFVVCYPQGLKDEKGKAFWQVGYNFHKNLKVNDVKFVKILTHSLQNKYNLSKNNVFITGFSNGGDFCNLLSCQTEGVFKAAAPIISCFMKEFYDQCEQAKAIPTFMLNGTHDQITNWDGDMTNQQGYGPYIPTVDMIDFRTRQINYDTRQQDTLFSNSAIDKTLIAIDRYKNSKTNNQVWMYKIINGGHGHPTYLDLEKEIWTFFSLYLDD